MWIVFVFTAAAAIDIAVRTVALTAAIAGLVLEPIEAGVKSGVLVGDRELCVLGDSGTDGGTSDGITGGGEIKRGKSDVVCITESYDFMNMV